MCYKVTDKQEEIVPVTQIFLLCHNEEDPENSHIKQFEAKEMKKMRDWKLPKEIKKKGLRFCRVKMLLQVQLFQLNIFSGEASQCALVIHIAQRLDCARLPC